MEVAACLMRWLRVFAALMLGKMEDRRALAGVFEGNTKFARMSSTEDTEALVVDKEIHLNIAVLDLGFAWVLDMASSRHEPSMVLRGPDCTVDMDRSIVVVHRSRSMAVECSCGWGIAEDKVLQRAEPIEGRAKAVLLGTAGLPYPPTYQVARAASQSDACQLEAEE